MSELDNKDLVERYADGLSKAASRAREMNSLAPNPMWLRMAKEIDRMKHDGIKLAKKKALTEIEILQKLNFSKGIKN